MLQEEMEVDLDVQVMESENGLDEEMDEDLDVEVMEGDVEETEVYNSVAGVVELPEKCKNCYQKKNPMVENREPYCLQSALYDCSAIQMGLKFCSFRQCYVRNEAEIVLCAECASFLVHGEEQDMKNVWPAFIWNVLRNGVIATHHGIGVWSYIPMKWHHWWIDEFVMLHAGNEGISMEMPTPIFEEITEIRSELMQSLKELKLGDLMRNVNKYLFPTVLCPWGCSEFPHKIELLSLDVLFFWYLGPGVEITRKGNTSVTRLKGSHDDYVDVSRVICLLMNPAWKVMPSIAFDEEKGPSVLVCRSHKGGSALEYIHVPTHPVTTLPARFSDQLSPAVVQSRVIQPMRAQKYSISFQMHEMRGSFAGLDSLSLGRFRRFDF